MEPDMKEMEHIRRQGYTLVDCEEQSYKQEAACPIFDFYGDIMAALTFVSIKDGNTERTGQKDLSFTTICGTDLQVSATEIKRPENTVGKWAAA